VVVQFGDPAAQESLVGATASPPAPLIDILDLDWAIRRELLPIMAALAYGDRHGESGQTSLSLRVIPNSLTYRHVGMRLGRGGPQPRIFCFATSGGFY
jgi:hypothetical protein